MKQLPYMLFLQDVQGQNQILETLWAKDQVESRMIKQAVHVYLNGLKDSDIFSIEN